LISRAILFNVSLSACVKIRFNISAVIQNFGLKLNNATG
jgi:hypothetical protein